MRLNKRILSLLSDKAGVDVSTPSGAAFLRNDIESVLAERLSLNTIKRLVGLLPYDSSPRDSTMDVLAQYLDYPSWKILNQTLKDKISDFNSSSLFIELSDLYINKEIIIRWSPNRHIKIRHLGEGRYLVVESQNSKLLERDELVLSQIALGFPFMAKDVKRNGLSLGTYTAALLEGIEDIEFVDG